MVQYLRSMHCMRCSNSLNIIVVGNSSGTENESKLIVFRRIFYGIDNFFERTKDFMCSRNMVLLAAINPASFDFVITHVNLGAFGEWNLSA